MRVVVGGLWRVGSGALCRPWLGLERPRLRQAPDPRAFGRNDRSRRQADIPERLGAGKLRVRPPLRPNKSERPRDPAVILGNVSEYTRRVAVAANICVRSQFSMKSIWMPRLVTSNV